MHRVAILDAGGQYVDLVRKAAIRQGFPADVLPLDTPRDRIEGKYDAIIISGSPASSHEETAPQPDSHIWQSPLPLLGICYGMQSMVTAHGGQVAKNAIREDGRITTMVDTSHPLFKGIKKDFTGLFTHGDFVTKVPLDFQTIGSHTMSDGSIAYSAIAQANKVGVQFHPEVFDDTPEGYQLFKNFLEGIAGLEPDENFLEEQLRSMIKTKHKQIEEQAGGRHVIAFVSGGVDSSVAATLAAAVIPKDRLHAYYIDSGFMRDEDDMVIEALKAAGLPVKKVDAVKDFEQAALNIDGEKIGPLTKITDPEEKRKIIGKTFIDIQNRLVAELKLEEALLLQGTNAADRIESGHSTGDTHTMTIKTHHNQVQEVQELKAAGMLIEPIDDLFKDEVRELGRQLGLPEELVERQPYPGPGLAIRIICSDESKDLVEPHEEQNEVQQFLDSQPSKTKGHLLPIRSVGVGGDERSHLSVIALENANLKGDDLAKLAHDLPAHFRGSINRVIYALTPGNLDKHTVTKTLLTADVREQLRHADRIVFEAMRAKDLLGDIKQFPVVLLPLSFGKPGERAIVLRPVTTSTFMTVQAMLPGRDLPEGFLNDIAERILKEVPGITQVFLDATNKPPATTEWE
ncbi:MAG TPA: gamma-glutamyl-gamma-aminobutyrate hydrolase family protein [Candidatus Saccharimonadales bacterium]|nr:gamma-glutamyl-gamma-aminobutyrate hydrolase family protein [Candidatus Saccharimonadales bacterium]